MLYALTQEFSSFESDTKEYLYFSLSKELIEKLVEQGNQQANNQTTFSVEEINSDNIKDPTVASTYSFRLIEGKYGGYFYLLESVFNSDLQVIESSRLNQVAENERWNSTQVIASSADEAIKAAKEHFKGSRRYAVKGMSIFYIDEETREVIFPL